MAVYADRVRETTNTSGLGAYSLNGAVGGFRTFSSAVPSGSTVVYCVEDGTSFEVGEGTLTVGTPNTISRTTVLSSSNNNQLVSWGAGTKNIFLTAASARMVITDRANTLTGSLSLPANGLAVGTNQLVTSGGNVGIGTSSPGAALDIANGPLARITNDSATLRLRSSSTNANYGELAIDSSGTTYLSSQTGNLFLSSQAASGQVLFRSGGGVERMRIDSAGNLGIGTTSPAARLHVSGSNTSLVLDRTGAEPAIDFRVSGTQVGQVRGVSGGGIRFTDATAGTEHVRITSTGNVGIGTASPTAILHTKTAGGEGLRIQGTASSAIIRFTDAADASTGFIGQNTTFDIYNQNSTAMRFGTGNTERMRIDNVGFVGVGVSPSPWDTTRYKSIQLGNFGAYIAGRSNSINVLSLGSNAYAASGDVWTYNSASQASRYDQDYGQHKWFTAPSGTAGTAITWTQAMTLDASGNLGIRTATPTNYSGSGYNSIAINGTTGGILEFQGNGTQAARLTGWSNTFAVHTNNAERVRVDSTGNVGIGTSLPGAKLEVSNGANSNGAIKISATGTTTGQFASMTYETGTANWVVGTEAGSGRFFVYSSASAQDLIRCTGGANGGSELYAKGSGVIAFHTASSVERMRVDASGNLALGTSLASARLQVQGNGSQDLGFFQQGGTSNALIAVNHQDAPGTNASARPVVSLRKGGTTMFNLSCDGGSSTQGLTYFESFGATGGQIFITNGGERMRLDASGNLGLGTSTPGYRLDVDHGAGVARFRNGTTGYGSIALGASATAANNCQLASDGSGNFIIYKGVPGSGTEQLRLTSQGSLGVGVSAPVGVGGSVGVHVSGPAASNPSLRLTNADTGTTATDGSAIFVGNAAGAGTGSLNVYNYEAAPIALFTSATERMRIDASGNVGIGTNNPTAFIDVVAPSSADTVLKMSKTGSHNQTIKATGGGLTIGVDTTDGNTERVRVQTSGNVLIGRSSQQSGGRLEVAGNIVANIPSTAPTLGTNSDMSFQLVSNTQLRILVRGSDGVTRSATLTLA